MKSKRKSRYQERGFKIGNKLQKRHAPEITPPPAQVDHEENETAENEENGRELRSGSQRAAIEPAPTPTSPYTMIMDSAALNSSLSGFACPKCGKTGTLNHVSTSLRGVVTSGIYHCTLPKCEFSSLPFTSCDSKMNDRVILGMKTLGIAQSQLSKFFLMLNIFVSYFPKSGNMTQRVVNVVNLDGPLFRKIIGKVNKGLVEKLRPTVEREALIEVENAPGPALIGIDGMYPNCLRNQTSQACLSALIARLPNCWKIIGSFITKRAQESKPNSNYKGNVVWGKNARSLEAMNAEELIQSHIIPIAQKKSVEISMDQDCRIKNLVEEKVKGPFEVKTTVDQAHITKNIRGHINRIIKKHGFMGDSTGRIGNRNLRNLIRICNKKIKWLCKRRKEKKISVAEIKKELNVLKMHCMGFHGQCVESGKFCNETLLHTYSNKFSATKLKAIEKELFDDYLTNEKMAQAVFEAGCTSQNEFFHSLLTNRRLIVKNDQISVLSYFYDANVAVGIILYNCGESVGFSRIFRHFGIELDCHIVSKFEMNEKVAVVRRERNMIQGPINHNKRVSEQAQYNPQTKSRKEYDAKYGYCSAVDYANSIQNIDTTNVTLRKKRTK